MADQPTEGIGLESRLLRVFLAQGSFAESRLFPAADVGRRMLATDIDVLVSEYGNGFDLTRRHVECKGGRAAVLDRVLWLNGVRTLLGAEASFLVLKSVDYDAARFAWDLHVQLMSIKQLAEWEASLGVDSDRWPCRSDFQAFEPARQRWHKLAAQKGADEGWGLLRETLAFIEIDSWLNFHYRHLNALLRHLIALGTEFAKASENPDKKLCFRYCASALLVRLAQYLLAICLDVTPVATTDLKSYLTERLTFGDQNPRHAEALIRGTVQWVKRALSQRNVELPADIDAERLFEAPPYAEEFVALVQRILSNSDNATCLPIALEVSQFDDSSSLDGFPRLKAAADKGDTLAALVKAFIVRSTPVSTTLLDGVGSDVRSTNRGSSSGKKGYGPPGEQLRLGADR